MHHASLWCRHRTAVEENLGGGSSCRFQSGELGLLGPSFQCASSEPFDFGTPACPTVLAGLTATGAGGGEEHSLEVEAWPGGWREAALQRRGHRGPLSSPVLACTVGFSQPLLFLTFPDSKWNSSDYH